MARPYKGDPFGFHDLRGGAELLDEDDLRLAKRRAKGSSADMLASLTGAPKHRVEIDETEKEALESALRAAYSGAASSGKSPSSSARKGGSRKAPPRAAPSTSRAPLAWSGDKPPDKPSAMHGFLSRSSPSFAGSRDALSMLQGGHELVGAPPRDDEPRFDIGKVARDVGEMASQRNLAGIPGAFIGITPRQQLGALLAGAGPEVAAAAAPLAAGAGLSAAAVKAIQAAGGFAGGVGGTAAMAPGSSRGELIAGGALGGALPGALGWLANTGPGRALLAKLSPSLPLEVGPTLGAGSGPAGLLGEGSIAAGKGPFAQAAPRITDPARMLGAGAATKARAPSIGAPASLGDEALRLPGSIEEQLLAMDTGAGVEKARRGFGPAVLGSKQPKVGELTEELSARVFPKAPPDEWRSARAAAKLGDKSALERITRAPGDEEIARRIRGMKATMPRPGAVQTPKTPPANETPEEALFRAITEAGAKTERATTAATPGEITAESQAPRTGKAARVARSQEPSPIKAPTAKRQGRVAAGGADTAEEEALRLPTGQPAPKRPETMVGLPPSPPPPSKEALQQWDAGAMKAAEEMRGGKRALFGREPKPDTLGLYEHFAPLYRRMGRGDTPAAPQVPFWAADDASGAYGQTAAEFAPDTVPGLAPRTLPEPMTPGGPVGCGVTSRMRAPRFAAPGAQDYGKTMPDAMPLRAHTRVDTALDPTAIRGPLAPPREITPAYLDTTPDLVPPRFGSTNPLAPEFNQGGTMRGRVGSLDRAQTGVSGFMPEMMELEAAGHRAREMAGTNALAMATRGETIPDELLGQIDDNALEELTDYLAAQMAGRGESRAQSMFPPPAMPFRPQSGPPPMNPPNPLAPMDDAMLRLPNAQRPEVGLGPGGGGGGAPGGAPVGAGAATYLRRAVALALAGGGAGAGLAILERLHRERARRRASMAAPRR